VGKRHGAILRQPAFVQAPVGDDDTVGVDANLIRELFLPDCDDATTEEAVARGE
jgi:hypothetical protein